MMTPIRRGFRPAHALLMLLGSAATLGIAEHAEAQFGFGGGFGYGGFFRPYTPPSVRTLNRVAVTRAGMDQEKLNETSLSTPDHYDYRRQAVSMQQRYDIQSTRGIDVDVRGRGTPIDSGSPGDGGGSPPIGSSENSGVQRPTLAITSFVNNQDQVVWPADAPISGDLLTRRDQADASIADVVQEYRAVDYAQISTVARARQDLLDYGQPALQAIRENSTSRVADTFHLFLLSLYDGLAQSAERGFDQASRNPPAPAP